MDFSVLTREESTELFESMLEHMPEEIISAVIKDFGSVEQWREHYLGRVSSEKVQKQYAKVVECYGGKDDYVGPVTHPLNKEIRDSYQRRIDTILKNLSAKRVLSVECFEVRELIGEYGFVMKQLLQIKQEKEIMLKQAQLYRDKQVQASTDEKYGDGFSDFISEAITSFYNC